jgi:uracil-DNA glycosylase
LCILLVHYKELKIHLAILYEPLYWFIHNEFIFTYLILRVFTPCVLMLIYYLNIILYSFNRVFDIWVFTRLCVCRRLTSILYQVLVSGTLFSASNPEIERSVRISTPMKERSEKFLWARETQIVTGELARSIVFIGNRCVQTLVHLSESSPTTSSTPTVRLHRQSTSSVYIVSLRHPSLRNCRLS